MRLNWLWSDKVHFFVQMISEWLSPADICFIINPSSPLMRLGFWIKSAVVSHWFEHQLNSLLSSVRARIWLSMIEMSITLFLFFDFLKRMKFELKSKVLNQDKRKLSRPEFLVAKYSYFHYEKKNYPNIWVFRLQSMQMRTYNHKQLW